MAAQPLPSPSRLAEVFDYEPVSGNLLWRTGRRTGRVAGSVSAAGYRRVFVDGKSRSAHRVIWTMVNGSIPAGYQVDHINRDRDDNRMENLRLALPVENQQNRTVKPLVGAVFIKGYDKWRGMIRYGGRQVHLGFFETAEAAHEAYVAAKRERHHFHPEIDNQEQRQ